MPMLNRNDTMTTLPMYSSRPGTPSSDLPAFELDHLGQKRPFHPRTATSGSIVSNSSFASNAPLMNNTAELGYRSASPAPSLRSLNTSFPQRAMTASSNNTNFSRPPGGPPGGPPRMPSAMGDRGYSQSPVSYDNQSPSAHMRDGSSDSYGRPFPRAVGDLRSNTPAGPAPSMGRRTPGAPYDAYSNGRSSPAPSSAYGEGPPGGFAAYNPGQRSASNASPAPYQQGPAQSYRSITDPSPRPVQGGDYFGGSTAPQLPLAAGMNGRGSPTDGGIARLASPAPYVNNANGRGTPGFGPLPPGGYRR